MTARTDHREVPPTAGLPLRTGDFFPGRRGSLPRAMAALTGDADALLTCSGTAALVVALTALARTSPRREVVVPAYTCPLVAIAVARSNLTLRVCDTRPGHFEMAPAVLRRICSSDTLAVVPAHLGGRVADIGAVNDIAHSVGALVIEDAAQALGARYADGTPVGRRGDIGFFSLAVGKGLSIFEGGLLTTTHPLLRRSLQSVAETCLPSHSGWELRRSLELLGYWAFYRPRGLKTAYGDPLRRALHRGDPVGAVGDRFPPRIPMHRVGSWREGVGSRAAARLQGFYAQLERQALRRLDVLRAINGLDVLDDPAGAKGTWPYFLLTLPASTTRDAVLEELWTAGVGVSRLFIHALPDYVDLDAGVPKLDVPNARDFAARSLTISNSPWLDDDTFACITDTLASVVA